MNNTSKVCLPISVQQWHTSNKESISTNHNQRVTTNIYRESQEIRFNKLFKNKLLRFSHSLPLNKRVTKRQRNLALSVHQEHRLNFSALPSYNHSMISLSRGFPCLPYESISKRHQPFSKSPLF